MAQELLAERASVVFSAIVGSNLMERMRSGVPPAAVEVTPRSSAPRLEAPKTHMQKQPGLLTENAETKRGRHCGNAYGGKDGREKK